MICLKRPWGIIDYEDELVLAAEDDRHAFEEGACERNDGLGLRAMKCQAELLGGAFAIESELAA